MAQLEDESGCPILSNYDGTRFGEPGFSPVFEAIEDYEGCYEIVAVLNDDGFGVAIFVPKRVGIDAELARRYLTRFMCSPSQARANGAPCIFLGF